MPTHTIVSTPTARSDASRGTELAITFAGRHRCRATELAIAERFDRFAVDQVDIGTCRVAIEAASEEPSTPCFLRVAIVICGEAFVVCERVVLDGSGAAAALAADRVFVELARRMVGRGLQRGPASAS